MPDSIDYREPTVEPELDEELVEEEVEESHAVEPEMDEDYAEELIESQKPEPEPMPEPENVSIDTLKFEAFCLGIDAACKMYGGLCNKGHKRQMAQKAGLVLPEE